MYKYQLTNKNKLDDVVNYLKDYLLEKERWLVVKFFSDVNYANQCSVLKEQIDWIQRKIHNRDETLNHYLEDYKSLSIEQATFLLCGFNPHSLDGECFKEFKLDNNDSLLSNYLSKKTLAGRRLTKDFGGKFDISIDKLIRWSSAKDFIFNHHNRVLSEHLTTSLHSLLVENELIEDGEIQRLWSWLRSDVLLAYLIDNLTNTEIIPLHHRWKVMESYIAQKGVKRLSKIESYKDSKPNEYRLVDSIITELKQLGF
jgi:hypothetical protein